MPQVLVDLGNTRLKWALKGEDGGLINQPPVSLGSDSFHRAWWSETIPPASLETSSWWIASVNPPRARELIESLNKAGVWRIQQFTNASQIPINHLLVTPETTGVDRALIALASSRRIPPGTPCLIVSCGTAITVERLNRQGVWEGGAILPGLRLSARSLARGTAQLPEVQLDQPPIKPFGDSTASALAAGLFWGTVGAIREIIAQQRQPEALVLWTGGDAPQLAPRVSVNPPEIIPALTLEGLAWMTRIQDFPSLF